MLRLEEFRKFYNHSIFPELVRMERKRRRLLTLFGFSILLLLGVFVFWLWLDIAVVSLVLMTFIAIYMYWLYSKINEFTQTFKPRVVELVLDFIDDGLNYGDLEYKPTQSISQKYFFKSQIFRANATVYEGEDLIKGNIGEIPFRLCELNVREASKVRQRLNYVFKGVFLHAEIPRKIPGKVIVLPRIHRQYLTKTLKYLYNSNAREIDMFIQNKEFRETFMTFGTYDARLGVVLSSSMQKAILEYKKRTGKDLYLSFIGKDIYLAVTEPKDILEPYLWKSNVSYLLVRQFYEDIQLMLSIVEDFDAHH